MTKEIILLVLIPIITTCTGGTSMYVFDFLYKAVLKRLAITDYDKNL